MFEKGSRVIYGIHGVCLILDIEERIIDRKKVEYFVLSPVDQAETRFYIPVNNQAAIAKLHPLLTKQELDLLLNNDLPEQGVWIADDNLRKQQYRIQISSGDRSALVEMIRALYRHKAAQIASGKKFHQCDENFLRDAQRLLSAEFAVVLGVSQDDAFDYIKNNIMLNDKSAAV